MMSNEKDTAAAAAIVTDGDCRHGKDARRVGTTMFDGLLWDRYCTSRYGGCAGRSTRPPPGPCASALQE